MYSNKKNVNILTSLLVAHGVRHVVVCPGSRNAPLAHNLNESPSLTCYPVTDERSAGFYALGMASYLEEPVAVCVTSGSAVVNLMPAVVEAFYHHVPLIVITADRPAQWIDQLDGQTLPQQDIFGRFVKKSVSLPEPHDEEEEWYCSRLVNEALVINDAPVHINVPINEPLFEFTSEKLPEIHAVKRCVADDDTKNLDSYIEEIAEAQRPMLVIGSSCHSINQQVIAQLETHLVVLYEPLVFHGITKTKHFDEILHKKGNDEDYQPDLVIYMGGTIVSKRLRQFLRHSPCKVIRVGRDEQMYDTFYHLTYQFVCSEQTFLNDLLSFEKTAWRKDYLSRWQAQLQQAQRHADTYQPDYSQLATVKCFEQQLQDKEKVCVHYANSTAIRLASIYANHYVACNRGVNGIEGSLSTAAGASVVTDEKVFCVIGDLSFFYDQNALWNQNLQGNFRILLMNNSKGGIFHLLKGLEQSPARDRLIAAHHQTSAEGICHQHNVVYQKAENMEQMQQGIDWLINEKSQRPMLLEVCTNVAEDERVFKDYYAQFKKNK